MNTLDSQYIALVKDVFENGVDEIDRTGIGTRSVFERSLRCNLKEGFPILTFRQHSFKVSFYETLMFLNGSTDTKKWLEANNISIWKGNTSREFLDSRGLYDLPEGDMGRAYGSIWRDFNGVDQLKNVFEMIKTDPYSRRLKVTAWKPDELHRAALPPCHTDFQFYIRNNTLNCSFNMRSLDVWLGCGADIQTYALITMFFAKALKMEVGELVMKSTDTHLYHNGMHIYEKSIKEFKSFDLPQLIIKKELNTLEDICNLQYSDVELVNYTHGGKAEKIPMAI